MKTETFSFEGLPFTVIQRGENTTCEIHNHDGEVIGLIDTSTSKQSLTRDRIIEILGDRAEVLNKILGSRPNVK
jgi:hypothetical protein